MSAFIVAEAGCNHLGDRKKMLAFCDAAKACGADAVKFQAYKSGNLVMRRKITDPETIMLLERAELTDADLDAIAAHCKAIGFKWFASVFDPSQVERVLSRGACALKIGHKEADWDGLLLATSYTRTNVNTWVSNPQRPLLDGHRAVLCQEEYPAKTHPELYRLRGREWRGYSSHWRDWRVPALAGAMGVEYLECHIALADDEPEAAWSLRPSEFAAMVEQVRWSESLLWKDGGL